MSDADARFLSSAVAALRAYQVCARDLSCQHVALASWLDGACINGLAHVVGIIQVFKQSHAIAHAQSDLETAVAQLASEGTQAHASLVSQCLRTLDGLSATLDLFHEVFCCCMSD